MRAIRIERTGGPEVLQPVEVEAPEPGPGQIRVRNEAVGLNYIDTYHRSGLYPVSLPGGLGLEGAGVVEAVGAGVTRFRCGDRVAYASGPIGAYAQSHVVLAARAVLLPEDIATDIAAAALLKGMTAEFLLRRCRPVQAGEVVLVQAAAGGVGSILVQWARALGALVIGTVGSARKAELARADGCDHVILYREEEVAASVRRLTNGRGVDVVYDGVGAQSFEGSLASLRSRGWLISFGNASGAVPSFPPLTLTRYGSLFFTRPTLADYVACEEELDASASALFAAIRGAAVRIRIDARWPLEDAALAHRALESRRTSGACLLIPGREDSR